MCASSARVADGPKFGPNCHLKHFDFPAFGLIERLVSLNSDRPEPSSFEHGLEPMQLRHLVAPIILLSAGTALATAVFLAEALLERRLK